MPFEPAVRSDDVELPEALGQVGRLAHVVDGLAHGPSGADRDELGLHAPAGRVLRVFEAARQRIALVGGKLVEDFRLLVLRQVLEDDDGVVGIELAHPFGHGLGRQLLEDLLADRIVDLGQGGKIEVVPHELDQPRSQLRIERLDQIADIGLMQIADQLAQQRRIGGLDRLCDPLDIILAHRPILPAQRDGSRCRGHVFFVEHAEPCRRDGTDIWACTLGVLGWQSATAPLYALALTPTSVEWPQTTSIMKMRSRTAPLFALAISAAVAYAELAPCPGNSDALGAARAFAVAGAQRSGAHIQ